MGPQTLTCSWWESGTRPGQRGTGPGERGTRPRGWTPRWCTEIPRTPAHRCSCATTEGHQGLRSRDTRAHGITGCFRLEGTRKGHPVRPRRSEQGCLRRGQP